MGKGAKANLVTEDEARRKGGGSFSNEKGKKGSRERIQHKEVVKAKKNVVGGVSRYSLSDDEEMKLMKLLAMLQLDGEQNLVEEIVEVAEMAINFSSDSDASDSENISEDNDAAEIPGGEGCKESLAINQLEIKSDSHSHSDSDSDSSSSSSSSSNISVGILSQTPLENLPSSTKSSIPEIDVASMARKLIRDGRRMQKEEKLKKAEDRNARKAVLRNMYNTTNPPTPSMSEWAEAKVPGSKESNLPKQNIKTSILPSTIRFQVKCEGKGNAIKLILIDRNSPVSDVIQLLRNKYNVSKKYNVALVTDSAFVDGNETILSEEILNEIQHEVNVTLVARANTKLQVQNEHDEVTETIVVTTGASLKSISEQELSQPSPIIATKITTPLKSSSYRPYVPTRDEREYNCDTPRVYPGDLVINEVLRAFHIEKQQNSLRYKKMRDSRHALPIFQSKQELLDIITHHQVSVVSGETGSGKSTQLPSYILDDMIENGKGSEAYIICTQPRRIAAISVAERVATERDESIGESVGYQVRLNSRYDKSKTRILFCTTGVLLRKLHDISFLGKISHILLDEVHERQVETDFLMTLLKKECNNYPHLRIVLMSATLQEELFGLYFNNCPVVHVLGRTFPVTQHFLSDINQLLAKAQKLVAVERGKVLDMASSNVYLNKKGKDAKSKVAGGGYAAHADIGDSVTNSRLPRFDPDGIVELVVRIIQMYTPPSPPTESDDVEVGEGVLVFLSGIHAIEKVNRILRQRLNATSFRDKVFIYILHGSLPPEQQRRVFKKTKHGEWKVVLATNIAETSITVDDITHVVDSGYMKEIRFDPTANISSLKECVISKAAARQRAGRAGRVRPGHCWKIYTSDFFEGGSIDEYPIPEIQRIPLEEVVLQVLLLNLGLPDVFLGLCINPPSMAQIRASVQVLLDIKAILPTENLALTALGYHLAKMPVDVRLGKMLITAALLQVHEPILTICAALSGKSPFLSPMDKREEATSAHRKYSMRKDSRFSDHLAIVNAYNDWRQAVSRDCDRRAYGFCQSNFLSANVMEDIHSLREYYRQYLVEAGFLLESQDKLALDGRSTESSDTALTARSAEHNEIDYAIVRCVLCAGLTPQVVRVCRYDDKTHRNGKGKGRQNLLPIKIIQADHTEVFIHPMSVAAKQKLGTLLEAVDGSKLKDSYLVYHTKVSSTRLYLHDVTSIPLGALLLFAGDIFISRQRERIIVDGWIHLKMSELHAVLYKRLQKEIESMLVVKIENTASDISLQQTLIHGILTELL